MKLPPDEKKVIARERVGDFEAVVVETTTHAEGFTFTTILGDVITWNVSAAKLAVAAGHVLGCEPLDPETMAAIEQNNEWTEAGVAAANPAEPGIAAPVIANIPGRRHEIIYVLIDGIHRCVRARRDGVPFRAYLLTDAANRLCIVRAPDEVVP